MVVGLNSIVLLHTHDPLMKFMKPAMFTFLVRLELGTGKLVHAAEFGEVVPHEGEYESTSGDDDNAFHVRSTRRHCRRETMDI
jgi:hypothetical protein